MSEFLEEDIAGYFETLGGPNLTRGPGFVSRWIRLLGEPNNLGQYWIQILSIWSSCLHHMTTYRKSSYYPEKNNVCFAWISQLVYAEWPKLFSCPRDHWLSYEKCRWSKTPVPPLLILHFLFLSSFPPLSFLSPTLFSPCFNGVRSINPNTFLKITNSTNFSAF